MSHCPLVLFCAAVVLAGSCVTYGQDAEAREEQQGQKGEGIRNIRKLTEIASAHEFAGGSTRDDALALHPQPLLTWSNPTRPAPYGGTFLWTQNGRPLVVGCLYEWNESGSSYFLCREFHSLADAPLLAEFEADRFWSPAVSGLEFRPVPQARPPAGSTTARLLQMKSIARQFSARLVQLKEQENFELRLLTTPLHRYGASGSQPEDGGLFAFVQGTDPEVLLLLQAQPATEEERSAWHYAMARMTSGALQVRFDDELIWEAAEIPEANLADEKGAYAVFSQRKSRQ